VAILISVKCREDGAVAKAMRRGELRQLAAAAHARSI